MERIEAADYYDIATPSSPRLSPDGERVAFVRTVPADEESTESTIYVVSTDGGEAQRFSLAEGTDAEPRWSPSGDRLAFTSTRGAEDDRQQLWVVPTDGGEGRQVTDVIGGVSGIAWSPNGRHIVFTQSVSPEEREADLDLDVPADHEREDPDPRVIDRTVYRSNQRYFDGRRSHVYVVALDDATDAPNPEAISRVTDGDGDATVARWLDDETLYYTDTWVGDDPDDSLEYDIVRHHLDTGRSQRIHRSTGWSTSLAVVPDGRVAFPVVEPDRASIRQVELAVYDPTNDDVRTVTANLDRSLELEVDPTWGPAGERVYFATPDEGTVTLWAGPGDGSARPTRLIREGHLSGADVGPSGDSEAGVTVAFTMSQWNHPGDVFLVDHGEVRRLTTLNDEYLEGVAVQPPEPVSFDSAQGPVEGWVLTPPEFDSAGTYPLVVEVHGGPHVMWTTAGAMWHEFQTLAARGYVVFWCNPRGSEGYGREFMEAIERDWGEVTLTDVLAGVETVAARPSVDEEAIYLTGGSFGGFLTAWALGTTDRFDAAVAQRGVYDLTAFYGSTDGAYKLVEGDFDATPAEAAAFLWNQSPVSRATDVDSPTLIIHSERDYRTPISGAELWYRLLRTHDVETRLVRYPREGHELSRSGEPGHVVDRLERIVRWFDGYSPYHEAETALDRADDDGLTAGSNAED